MKRQVYQMKAGNFKNLQLADEELPAPEAEEVTVVIKAIGLNFADVFAAWGLYGATPKGTFIPGLEYAGEIVAKGANVSDLELGQRVMGVTRFGAYSTHLNIQQAYVSPVPADWSIEEGAAFLVQGLTAYYGLTKLGDLQDNQCVLIHSAAGGVGTLANRIAKTKNAYTIGTVGSAAKVAFCKKNGYDAVIVRDGQFEENLIAAVGNRKLSVIMECIGGEILAAGWKNLGPMGRMVVYGAAHYATTGDRPNYLKVLWKYFNRPKIDPGVTVQQNKGLLGFNLIYLYEEVELMKTLLEEMDALNLEAPHVGQTFSFDQLPDALRIFRSGNTVGKVVVQVP